MRGRARFHVTTKSVCVQSLKDCVLRGVLEMTSAKYHVRIEFLDVWKNTGIFEVKNRIMKLHDRMSP